MSESEAFWAHVQRADESMCWPWTGKTIRGGYGDFVVSRDGKQRHVIAHRWTWQDANGPIPAGIEVCHRCDNPACVNPAHLFLGTRLDNERDKIAKGRRPSTAGTENPNARLTVDDVCEIRRLVASGAMTRTAIGERFNLGHRSVSRIASGESWPNVDGPLSPPGRRGRPRKRP